MNFFKKHKLLLLIILLSLLLRIVWLDRVPTGISNDELDYLLDAKALYLSGSDISGTWNPFSFTTPKSGFPKAEIPPLLTFLPIGLLPLSLFNSKLIYALIGVGTVAVLYLITKKLLGEKEAFFVGLVGTFNPWLIYFSRTAYDTPLAIFCFLLAFYLLLVTRGWKILYAFPFFFIGFYSYIGTKLILVPFSFIIIFYSWYIHNKKQYTKQYLILFCLCILLVGYYTVTIIGSTQSRVSQLSTPNIPAIVETTNRETRLSIDTPLTHIFSNRYVVFSKYSFEKYINAFSPNFLFLFGDGKSLFTVWYNGVFYYIDGIFLLVGLCTLFVRSKKVFALLGSLIIIAPIPSAASNFETSYAIRSMLLGPLFSILIGFGIYTVIFSIKRVLYRRLVIAGIIFIYTVLVLNFANIYFFRNPIYNSDAFNFSARELSKYLFLQNSEKKTFVVTGDPRTPFKHYLFYTNLYARKTVSKVQEIYRTKNYSFNGINFITCSEIDKVKEDSLLIFESGTKCKPLLGYKKYLTIAQLSDAGGIYSIVNDKTCGKYKLDRFPNQITFFDLKVENLSEQQFCQKFITNYFQ